MILHVFSWVDLRYADDLVESVMCLHLSDDWSLWPPPTVHRPSSIYCILWLHELRQALNQARRSQDLMMSQIENQPGGFNVLRRLYTVSGVTLRYSSTTVRCSTKNDTRYLVHHGTVQDDTARYGMVRCNTLRSGTVGCSTRCVYDLFQLFCIYYLVFLFCFPPVVTFRSRVIVACPVL